MSFKKLLWFDLRRGLFQKPLFFIIPTLIALISCFDLYRRVLFVNPNETLGIKISAGFADFLTYLYGGTTTYDPYSGNPFARWMLVLLSVCFLTLHYPNQDVQTYGQQLLIRTQSRLAWWLSKCIWNMAGVLLYHGLLILSAALFCLLVQADFTGGPQKELLYHLFQVVPNQRMPAAAPWNCCFIVLPILVSLALNLLQMTFALFVKPILSFSILSSLMVSSACFASPCLVGNYAMILRLDTVTVDGVSIKAGVIFSLLLLLLSVMVGCVRFARCDILNQD